MNFNRCFADKQVSTTFNTISFPWQWKQILFANRHANYSANCEFLLLRNINVLPLKIRILKLASFRKWIFQCTWYFKINAIRAFYVLKIQWLYKSISIRMDIFYEQVYILRTLYKTFLSQTSRNSRLINSATVAKYII